MSACQEREEKVRSYLARLRGLSGVCKLTVECTAETCTEKVSYANRLILHSLVRGLYDIKTKEELLSKNPMLDLHSSLTFVESKKVGKRLVGCLGAGGMASCQVKEVTVYQQDKKERLVNELKKVVSNKHCLYCDSGGHGEKLSRVVRETKCRAFKEKNRSCHVVWHL